MELLSLKTIARLLWDLKDRRVSNRSFSLRPAPASDASAPCPSDPTGLSAVSHFANQMEGVEDMRMNFALGDVVDEHGGLLVELLIHCKAAARRCRCLGIVAPRIFENACLYGH